MWLNNYKNFVPWLQFLLQIPTTYLKPHISKPQYGRQDTEYAITHLSRNMKDIESQSQCIKFFCITNTINFYATRLIQVLVEICRLKLQLICQFFVALKQMLWKNVILASIPWLFNKMSCLFPFKMLCIIQVNNGSKGYNNLYIYWRKDDIGLFWGTNQHLPRVITISFVLLDSLHYIILH